MPIGTLTPDDFSQWENLFRQYIAFYKTSLPDAQYRKTFDRILDPKGDLDAFVIRDEKDGKLKGLAHYLFHGSSWTDGEFCYLNDLFVDPDVRKKGYGRSLIVAVGKAAEEKGAEKLYWMTQHGNATARRVYDTFAESGFTEYEVNLPKEGKW